MINNGHRSGDHYYFHVFGWQPNLKNGQYATEKKKFGNYPIDWQVLFVYVTDLFSNDTA